MGGGGSDIHHHAVFSPPQNEYMKDDFMIKIETWHKPDMGTIENVSKHKKQLQLHGVQTCLQLQQPRVEH